MKNLKPIIFSFAAAATILASGCNTVQGVGQDLESVGKKTTEVARDSKQIIEIYFDRPDKFN